MSPSASPTRNTPDGTAEGWRPTIAHFRATVVAITLISMALLWRRPDLLVLATPMSVVALWSVLTRPTAIPVVNDRLGHPTIQEGAATTWRAQVSGADGADVVSAVVEKTPWIDLRPRHGGVTVPVVDGSAELSVAVRSTRWGRRTIAPIRVVAAGPWAAFQATMTTPPNSLTTLPLPAVFDAAAPIRPTDGLAGQYRSARPGDGSEFAASRAFAPGDRMRRINWPRSLRSGDLQVNSTWADRDTHVALVVDATEDYGVSEGLEGLASSLDTTVRAAGAIAEHHSRSGDRVSLRVFGAVGQPRVAAASGQANLRRVLDSLANVRPGVRLRGRYRRRYGPRWAANGAELTVMLSPLIGPEALDRAVSLGRHGLPVVVIDTLPAHVTFDEDPYTALAWRIRLLERRRETRRVQQLGIPVVRWLGRGSLDQFLRDVARRASAPRLRVR